MYKKSIIDHLFLVDNSESDNLKLFAEGEERISYIYNNKNLGYGSAHNIAIKRAFIKNSDYHIILNPDIEFRPEIISIILNFMEAHKDVGQLLPKVVYSTGKIQYLCKMLPTPLDLICKRFLPQNLMDKRMAKF